MADVFHFCAVECNARVFHNSDTLHFLLLVSCAHGEMEDPINVSVDWLEGGRRRMVSDVQSAHRY